MPHQVQRGSAPVGGMVHQPGEVGNVFRGNAATEGETPSVAGQPRKLLFKQAEAALAAQVVMVLRIAVQADLQVNPVAGPFRLQAPGQQQPVGQDRHPALRDLQDLVDQRDETGMQQRLTAGQDKQAAPLCGCLPDMPLQPFQALFASGVRAGAEQTVGAGQVAAIGDMQPQLPQWRRLRQKSFPPLVLFKRRIGQPLQEVAGRHAVCGAIFIKVLEQDVAGAGGDKPGWPVGAEPDRRARDCKTFPAAWIEGHKLLLFSILGDRSGCRDCKGK